MKTINKTFVLSVCFFLSFGLSTITQASKIVYVNIDALLASLPQLKQASKDIKAEFSDREKALIALSQSLKTRLDIFQNKKNTMLESKAKKELTALVKLESELKSKSKQLNTDVRAKNELVLQGIQDKINDAIKVLALKNKYDLVLYQQVAYASENIDITTLVHKILTATPAPAATPAPTTTPAP